MRGERPDWAYTVITVLRWVTAIAFVVELWNHYPNVFWGILRFLVYVVARS